MIDILSWIVCLLGVVIIVWVALACLYNIDGGDDVDEMKDQYNKDRSEYLNRRWGDEDE